MASQVSAFIYGQEGNFWPGYQEWGFPTDNVVFIPLTPPVVRGSVTMKSKIKVIGNSNDYSTAPEFYTDKTVAQLITDSNL